ncbi:PC-esterase domain-containing protein 1A-like isoform X2 [Ambystoma mexicanum]|uniref:PC-esterase domain-containing protein 1A-like isoform X2 n=1 Tax=Ambystoma mexicanum TaxID=8296 RepID=UPI0037E76D5F
MAAMFSAEETQQLLHNKFVAILGDSIQRSAYKDLVLLLQTNDYLSTSQLRAKGELSFEHDLLVEGGRLGELTNGTKYREVRQYRTDHHLVRYYFLTRVYSDYLESILSDFKSGPQPDVLIINSCVWDVSRYGAQSMEDYKVNLEKMFTRMDEVLLPECLMLWNMAMPLARKITGGFLIPELQYLDKTLRRDIMEANFYSATLAASHKFDVLDLHYHFRFDSQNRLKDGVHWNQIVHRKITQLLLAHLADAWGVTVPKRSGLPGSCPNDSIDDVINWLDDDDSDSESGSNVFNSDRDKRCNAKRIPSLVCNYERDRPHHRRPARPRTVRGTQSHAALQSGAWYDENNDPCAPQRYANGLSYQQWHTESFNNCAPPAYHGADNMEPYFYDDSPVLCSRFSPGYTHFEERIAPGPSCGPNGMPFRNSSSNFPTHNFGNFPHHSEYSQAERRHGNENFVMRRPLKSREVMAPYYRPQNYRSYRY